MSSISQQNDKKKAEIKLQIVKAARLAITDRDILKNQSLDDLVENGPWLIINQPRELFEAAERRARAELALKPNSATAMVRLAQCMELLANGLHWQEQDKLAKEVELLYTEALRINEQDVAALVGKSMSLLRGVRWQTDKEVERLANLSIKYCSKAIQLEEESYRAWNIRGLANLRLAMVASTRTDAIRLYERAINNFKTTLEMRRDFYPALANWGRALLNQATREIDGPEEDEMLKQAVERFKIALTIYPIHEDSMLGLANTLIERAKFTLAHDDDADELLNTSIQICEQALVVWPNSFDALSGWGNAIHEQARRRAGVEISRLCTLATIRYKASLTIKPNNPLPLANLGSMLLFQASAISGSDKTKLATQALEYLKDAIALKPDYYWAHARMAAALRFKAIFEPNEKAIDTLKHSLEKCQAALLRRADYHIALEEWIRNLRARAERTIQSDAIRLLQEAVERAAESHRIWPKRENLMLVWAECLYDLATRQSWSESTITMDKAAQVYANTQSVWPRSYRALHGMGRTLVSQARKSSADEVEAKFGHAYKKFSSALINHPQAANVLADWGAAIRQQADMMPSLRKRLLNEAEEKLQSALSLMPGHTYSQATLAAVLEDKARLSYGTERDSILERARHELNIALASEPKNSFALCVLGNVLMRQAERRNRVEAFQLYIEAAGKFNDALQIRPNNAWALERSGWALINQARLRTGAEAQQLYLAADEQFQAALQLEPDSPIRINSRALALAQRARNSTRAEFPTLYQQAYELFAASVNIWPDSAITHLHWANTLVSNAIKSNDWSEAPVRAEELYSLADGHFEHAIWFDASNWVIHRDKARALGLRARFTTDEGADQCYADAEKLLDQALTLNAPHELILLDRANLDLERARKLTAPADKDALIGRAITSLRESVQISPEFDDALYALAQALFSLSRKSDDPRLAEACDWYERAYAASPHRPEILLDWARLLRIRQEYEAAAEKAQSVLALDQNNVAAHRLRAELLKLQALNTTDSVRTRHAFEEAEAHLREITRLVPGSAETHAALAEVLIMHAHAEMGQYNFLLKQALFERDQAIKLAPISSIHLAERASTQSKWAEVDLRNAAVHINAALADLSMASSLDPTNPMFLQQRTLLLRRRAKHENETQQKETLWEAEQEEAAVERLKQQVKSGFKSETNTVNSNRMQRELRNLTRSLQEHYGVAESPSVDGPEAANVCRALMHALLVVEADYGVYDYIRGNFPIGRETNLSIEARIEQAINQFEKSQRVNGQSVNQILECLYVLLDGGKLVRPERTITDSTVDKRKVKSIEKLLENNEILWLTEVMQIFNFLLSAYYRANST